MASAQPFNSWLNAIAMLIDTRDGSVVNVAKAHIGEQTAIGGVSADPMPRGSVHAAKAYDLQGRRIVAPQHKGIYIVNGSVLVK